MLFTKKKCLIRFDPDRSNGTCILSSHAATERELLLFEPRFNLYARKNDCSAIPRPGIGTTPLGSPSTTTNIWTAPGSGTTSNDFITSGPQSTVSTPFSGSTTNQNSGESTPWDSTTGPSTVRPDNSGYGVQPTSGYDAGRPSDRPSAFGSERPTFRPVNDRPHDTNSGYGDSRPTAPSGYDRPSGYESGGTASSGYGASGRPAIGYGTGYSYGHSEATKERERAPPYHPNAVTGQNFDFSGGGYQNFPTSGYPSSSGGYPAFQSSPTAGYGGPSTGGHYQGSGYPTSGPNFPIVYHDKNSSSSPHSGGGSLSHGYQLGDQIEENRGKF